MKPFDHHDDWLKLFVSPRLRAATAGSARITADELDSASPSHNRLSLQPKPAWLAAWRKPQQFTVNTTCWQTTTFPIAGKQNTFNHCGGTEFYIESAGRETMKLLLEISWRKLLPPTKDMAWTCAALYSADWDFYETRNYTATVSGSDHLNWIRTAFTG